MSQPQIHFGHGFSTEMITTTYDDHSAFRANPVTTAGGRHRKTCLEQRCHKILSRGNAYLRSRFEKANFAIVISRFHIIPRQGWA
jgi:hypothetical protein